MLSVLEWYLSSFHLINKVRALTPHTLAKFRKSFKNTYLDFLGKKALQSRHRRDIQLLLEVERLVERRATSRQLLSRASLASPAK